MKFRDIYITAQANMFRSRLRSWLTILAVFVGAFTLTITNGIGAGISSYIDEQIGNLGNATTLTIEAKSANDAGPPFGGDPQKYDPNKRLSAPTGGFAPQEVLLSDNDLQQIRQQPGVIDAYAGRMVVADYIEGVNSERYQVNIGAASGRNAELASGRMPDDAASGGEFTLPENFVAVLGYESNEDALGQRLSFGLNDATGSSQQVQGTVVGIQKPTLLGSHTTLGNHPMLTAMYEAQSQGLSQQSKSNYSFIIAKVADTTSEAELVKIKDQLDSIGYSATTFNDELGMFKQVINIAIVILNIFAGIVLLAASFGIVNTLLMAVQERTKEIGLMKALGMSRQQIFTLFSIEAVLLGAIGSVLGIGIGVVVGLLANIGARNSILADFDGFNLLAFSPVTLALIAATIIGLAFLAGTLPARRAASQDPITALRYE